MYNKASYVSAQNNSEMSSLKFFSTQKLSFQHRQALHYSYYTEHTFNTSIIICYNHILESIHSFASFSSFSILLLVFFITPSNRLYLLQRILYTHNYMCACLGINIILNNNTSYYMCMITNSFVQWCSRLYSYYNIYHGDVYKILPCDLYNTQLGMVTMAVRAQHYGCTTNTIRQLYIHVWPMQGGIICFVSQIARYEFNYTCLSPHFITQKQLMPFVYACRLCSYEYQISSHSA